MFKIIKESINIEVSSIKRLKYDNKIDKDAYYILNTSYPESAKFLEVLDDSHMLLLNYDDVTNGSNSFNSSLANQVRQFIDKLNSSDLLYVCCDHGESRSAAMAAAIMRYFGEDEMKIWDNPHYHPNLLVYDTLCKAFKLDNSEERLKRLKEINDESLSRTINQSRK